MKIEGAQIGKEVTGKTPISLGIVGFGSHCFKSHVAPTMELPSWTLKAVADPHPERYLPKVAEPGIVDIMSEETLMNSGVQAVVISSPDHFHAPSLLKAVQAGKHVFVEKPLAVTSAQLEMVREALTIARERGLVVTSCHPRRTDPGYQGVRDTMLSLTNELGKVLHVALDFSYHQPSEAWKTERGLLLDHISHEIDYVNFLLGCVPFSAIKLSDSFDRYEAHGVRDDGVTFSFHGSRRLEERHYHEWATIRFERGELRCKVTSGEASVVDHRDGTVQPMQLPKVEYQLRGGRIFENFIGAIQGTEQCYLSHDELLMNTALGVLLTEQERCSL